MELRKDYILDRYVIISEGRGKRPKEFKKEKKSEEEAICFFCPGSEHLTPPEISRLGQNHWLIRVFPNKFPFVKKEGTPKFNTADNFFTYSNPFGDHEVLVETPVHEEQLWDLPKERIKDVFKVYNERINALSADSTTKYVVVFKNHGSNAGTSLVHSHTQIASTNIIPPQIADEVSAVKKHDSCPYCKIINIEKQSDRRCFENNSFVAFTPYASRFNYEIWIFSKKHVKTLDELSDEEFLDLASVMENVISRLKEINASYNFFIHYSPKGEDLHFHIELIPRIATWAGFEFSSGIIVNSVNPEQAAAFYRGELK